MQLTRQELGGRYNEPLADAGTTWRQSHCHRHMSEAEVGVGLTPGFSLAPALWLNQRLVAKGAWGLYFAVSPQRYQIGQCKAGGCIRKQLGKWSPHPISSAYKENEEQHTGQTGSVVSGTVQVWCAAGHSVIFHVSYSHLFVITEFSGNLEPGNSHWPKGLFRYNVFCQGHRAEQLWFCVVR